MPQASYSGFIFPLRQAKSDGMDWVNFVRRARRRWVRRVGREGKSALVVVLNPAGVRLEFDSTHFHRPLTRLASASSLHHEIGDAYYDDEDQEHHCPV